MFDHPVITAIANKHDKDNAQVLVRWTLQKGCGFSCSCLRSLVLFNDNGDLTGG